MVGGRARWEGVDYGSREYVQQPVLRTVLWLVLASRESRAVLSFRPSPSPAPLPLNARFEAARHRPQPALRSPVLLHHRLPLLRRLLVNPFPSPSLPHLVCTGNFTDLVERCRAALTTSASTVTRSACVLSCRRGSSCRLTDVFLESHQRRLHVRPPPPLYFQCPC